jgi:tartrate-resistant acid phosphatase type 5
MYGQGIFAGKPWYQTIGNHDVVKGQAGVDFLTKIAPIYDPRWNFVRSSYEYPDSMHPRLIPFTL